jgi:hypothetical protein
MEGDKRRLLHFAGRFLFAALGVIVAIWSIGAAFAFSRWMGFLGLGVLGVVLYSTAPRWVRWLPGLLIFGVINSFIGLITHHSPTNPQVAVPEGGACLLIAFYTVGCIVAYHYDATRLLVVDRVALLLYLFCMIWPAFRATNLTSITPVVVWSTSIGMAGLIASFVVHRAGRGKVK